MKVYAATLFVFLWLPGMTKPVKMYDDQQPIFTICEKNAAVVTHKWGNRVTRAGGRLRTACEVSV